VDEESKKQKINVTELIIGFVTPMLLGKFLILYFGSAYSNNPGEGYGYGLVISIVFTLCMMARLLWKYRNHED